MPYTGEYSSASGNTIADDYSGSYEDWLDIATRTLAQRYAAGYRDFDQFSGSTAGIGQPNSANFGTAKMGASEGVISSQTYKFFESYLRQNGGSDPYIMAQYGTPPTRNATFRPDPNSPSSLYGTFGEKSAWESGEKAKDRAAQTAISAADNAARIQAAQISANAQIQSSTIDANARIETTRMGVESDWKIATLQDATRRYVAEGDWGVQRYVAELQDKGMTARLQMELGQRDKELAQRAVEEKARHQEQMVGLALEVAKYDAELSAQPRNWLKYAAWLKSRDVVVNGLTLSMAADLVPDSAITPATVANTTGSGIGAIQTAQESLTSGASGGATSTQDAFGAQTQPLTGAGATGTQTQQQGQAAVGAMQPTISAEQLGQTTDYAGLARSLLGMNGLEASADQASTSNLQAIADTQRTSGGRQPGFGAYNGPTTNAFGVEIPEATGQKTDYRSFSNLLPSQQEMKFGAVESLGRYAPDYAKEIQRSRPKGGVTGAASYG